MPKGYNYYFKLYDRIYTPVVELNVKDDINIFILQPTYGGTPQIKVTHKDTTDGDIRLSVGDMQINNPTPDSLKFELYDVGSASTTILNQIVEEQKTYDFIDVLEDGKEYFARIKIYRTNADDTYSEQARDLVGPNNYKINWFVNSNSKPAIELPPFRRDDFLIN